MTEQEQAEIVATKLLGWRRVDADVWETKPWHVSNRVFSSETLLKHLDSWTGAGETLEAMSKQPEEVRKRFDESVADRVGAWFVDDSAAGCVYTWEKFHKLTPAIILECAAEVMSDD